MDGAEESGKFSAKRSGPAKRRIGAENFDKPVAGVCGSIDEMFALEPFSGAKSRYEIGRNLPVGELSRTLGFPA